MWGDYKVLPVLGRLVRWWLPPIVWASLILLASGDVLSSSETRDWLETAVRTVVGHNIDAIAFDAIHLTIRKSAHVIEYAILALLWLRALRAGRSGWTTRWAAAAVLLCLVIASIDEAIQSTTSLRTGTPWDVLIDVCAAFVAVAITQRTESLQRSGRSFRVLSSNRS